MSDPVVHAMWDHWEANLRLTWDENEYSEAEVLNLLMRAGLCAGIGEGRPGSNSYSMGWGRFRIRGYDINE